MKGGIGSIVVVLFLLGNDSCDILNRIYIIYLVRSEERVNLSNPSFISFFFKFPTLHTFRHKT